MSICSQCTVSAPHVFAVLFVYTSRDRSALCLYLTCSKCSVSVPNVFECSVSVPHVFAVFSVCTSLLRSALCLYLMYSQCFVSVPHVFAVLCVCTTCIRSALCLYLTCLHTFFNCTSCVHCVLCLHLTCSHTPFTCTSYPEWLHRQGGCLACWSCKIDSWLNWGCTDLYYALGAQRVMTMRVGGCVWPVNWIFRLWRHCP